VNGCKELCAKRRDKVYTLLGLAKDVFEGDIRVKDEKNLPSFGQYNKDWEKCSPRPNTATSSLYADIPQRCSSFDLGLLFEKVNWNLQVKLDMQVDMKGVVQFVKGVIQHRRFRGLSHVQHTSTDDGLNRTCCKIRNVDSENIPVDVDV